MAGPIDGARVAFVVANEGVEQIELTSTWDAVREAGGRPELLAPESGTVQAFNHLDRADTFSVDRRITDADPDDYDALVLPGGVANADDLRTDAHAVHFVHRCVEAGKPVSVICHAPWLLVEAGAVRDRTLTSYPSLKTDITNAGGEWVDEAVRVDGNLVTSRRPKDLPAFNRTTLERIEQYRSVGAGAR
jgi:protease I